MELPFNDSSPPMFAESPENDGSSSSGAADPIPQPGSFHPTGYHAPLFRPEEFREDVSKQQPERSMEVTGAHNHNHNHPPNCKSCGKPKIAPPAALQPSQNGEDHENTSSTNSTWKIVLWVVLGVVGLIIAVAIFRCMTSNAGCDILPFSPPELPSLAYPPSANANIAVEAIRSAAVPA